MNVHWITESGAEPRDPADLPRLLVDGGGFVWVDVPHCDDQAATVLGEVFGLHPMAIRDCQERSHLPKVHAYADHMFVILHTPEIGADERVHLHELDQFIGRRFLITVHGPSEAGTASDPTIDDTRTALQRLQVGRIRPHFPAQLSYSIVSALARRIEALVWAYARKVDTLEHRVMHGHRGDPEQTLESMFYLRHELLTIRTIAAHSREAYVRIGVLAPRFLPPEERTFFEDLADQFDRIRSMCDGEQEALRGVIDFYQNRTITKLNIAMERLALITVLLLPVTAIASVYGMNIIVNQQTQMFQLGIVLLVILSLMATIFLWARRQGWW